MKKKIILSIANFISIFWCLLPFKLRKFLFTSLFIIESRGKNTKAGLKRIFKIKDKLDWIINERAIIYGNGIHPKHKVTTYHEFFIDRVCDGEIVLDVGCGNGNVAIDIASQRPKSFVIGVDINVKNNTNLTSPTGTHIFICIFLWSFQPLIILYFISLK